MDLSLKRLLYRESGIFGSLYDSNNAPVAITLEHAYPDAGTFNAKIPIGTYTCVQKRLDLQV